MMSHKQVTGVRKFLLNLAHRYSALGATFTSYQHLIAHPEVTLTSCRHLIAHAEVTFTLPL